MTGLAAAVCTSEGRSGLSALHPAPHVVTWPRWASAASLRAVSGCQRLWGRCSTERILSTCTSSRLGRPEPLGHRHDPQQQCTEGPLNACASSGAMRAQLALPPVPAPHQRAQRQRPKAGRSQRMRAAKAPRVRLADASPLNERARRWIRTRRSRTGRCRGCPAQRSASTRGGP
jgi:hypothetical protein